MAFGDFETLCRTVPSYPWCNLFYRQALVHNPSTLLGGLSQNQATAPVGINPECGTLLVNSNGDGSLGNIANIIACGLSIFFVVILLVFANRRHAAVGRVELQTFLVLYLLTLPFQLLSTGAVIEQGTRGLVIVTAIHAGLVATTFWTLLANAIVATQVVEDGTLSSTIPINIFNVFFFAATTYISLDVGFTITNTFGPSNPPEALRSIPLFVLTTVWPAAATFLYFVIISYVILGVLRERRPMLYYVLALVLFVLSQLDYFLLNKVICNRTSAKIDGSFVATVLETLSVAALFFGWKSITEDGWDDPYY